jgi:uncharacterized coiled-coil protein SlyX
MKMFYRILAIRVCIVIFYVAALAVGSGFSDPVPFFVYNTTTPNESQRQAWNRVNGINQSDTLNLGFVFKKSDPSLEIIGTEQPSAYNYNDIKALKDLHFDDKSGNSRYIMYMILRMIDFQTAKKISGDGVGVDSHHEAIGETIIPIKNSKGKRNTSGIALKDFFGEDGDEITMKTEPTKTDIGALFLVASRCYTEKYFNKPHGIEKIWDAMAYLSKLFLKKSILNNITSRLRDDNSSAYMHQAHPSLMPSDSELAFLLGQYTSILEYRDLLLNGRHPGNQQSIDSKAFRGFNPRMYGNLMNDLKGTIQAAGDELFSSDLVSQIKNTNKAISQQKIEDLLPELQLQFNLDLNLSGLLTKNKKDQFLHLFGEEMESQFSLYNIETASQKETTIQSLNDRLASLSQNSKTDEDLQSKIDSLTNQIELLKSQKRNNSANDKNDDCAICLETFKDTTVGYSNDCSHYFHTHCWANLRKHRSGNLPCPLCRTRINYKTIRHKEYNNAIAH